MRSLGLIALSVIALSGCATPSTPQLATAEFGAPPADVERAAKDYFATRLKDPMSAQYTIGKTYKMGCSTLDGRPWSGWVADIGVNSKNSYGGYTGMQTVRLFFKGDEVFRYSSLSSMERMLDACRPA